MSEPHQMFTTWSGVPGEPDVWCLTCSANRDEPVSWEQCTQSDNTPPSQVAAPNESERINP